MATILDNKKSNGGSPYCYYTVTANYSARTTFGVTISGTITAHLASSSSSLGTGPTMGLNAYFTLNGVEQNAVSIKATDSSWSGTGNHNTNYSFTITGLTPTQTSVPISFRVSRTGSAANDYSKSSALKTTACTPLDIAQGVGQSTFNSISNCFYNGTFNMSITSYSGYDVLYIKNGSNIIQTFNGVTNGTAYSFDSVRQAFILSLIGANNTYVDLTATLITYVSNGGASLGSTDKTIRVSLPDYSPDIWISAISDDVSTYNTYKIAETDLIKSLSKAHITIGMSNNYGNTYTEAYCNGVSGTITNRTAVFSNLTQNDYYDISVTDSRGKTGTKRLYGNQYGNCDIYTVQWYKGSLKTTVVRPSPTGTTATVTVTPNVYDGTNLKSSALLGVAFTFTYTESGSSTVNVSSSSFTENSGVYTYTMQNLDPTKTVSWSISGTDKIGVATNGDSNTLQIGLPIWNAYKNSNGSQVFRINGDENVYGAIDVINSGEAVIKMKNVVRLLAATTGSTFLSANNNNVIFRPKGPYDPANQAYFGANGNLNIKADTYSGIIITAGDNYNESSVRYYGKNNGNTIGYVAGINVGSCGDAWGIYSDSSGKWVCKVENNGTFTTNGGSITINKNSRWIVIGNENTAFAHYQTSADVGHWFNKNVYVDGNIYAGSGYNKLVPYDEGWVDCWSVASGLTCKVRRIGKQVFLRITGSISNGSTGQKATIPDGYRPNDTYHFFGHTGGKRISRWWVSTNGACGFDWAINISNAGDYNSTDWVELNSWWFID